MSHPHPRPLPLVLMLFALGFGGLSACADKAESRDASAGSAPALAAAPGQSGAQLPASSRALRITAELHIAVGDVDGSVHTLRGAVTESGGYVSDARVAGDGDRKKADLEARVPVSKLASFRETIAGTGTITSESEKAEDVTEQRADLKARLKNARAQEKRLLDLLSDRTGSLADVIAAEKALSEVREIVERLEAADTALDGQIAFATVKLHISQNGAPEPASASGKVGAALSRGITLAGQAVIGAAIVAATAGPTLLLFAALAYAMYRVARAFAGRFKPKTLPYPAPPRA